MSILNGKKVIIIGDRDGVPGPAIEECAMSALRTSIKKADAALEAKSEDRAAAVTAAVKKIDQAAAKGLIHKNTAARRKSALALKLNRA